MRRLSDIIRDCFELIMGGELLDSTNPYKDAARKSEECFQLDQVHKYVVVCASEDVVDAAVQEGLRTIVVTEGHQIDSKLAEKCWKIVEKIDINFRLEYY